MTPIVLIHGGGLDRRCWDRLAPYLVGPVLAVDLPGRGAHPAPLDTVGFAACATSVRADIDAAGFDDVVLVGHSLAGCSMPAMIGVLEKRVRHAVFVACTVPEDGHRCFDTLDSDIQEMIRAAGQPQQPQQPQQPRPMDPALAKVVLGDDLNDEQLSWCLERLVPEAPRLTMDPVDLSPLHGGVACSWVCTLQDIIVPAAKQRRFANNVGTSAVIDLDAGHMCMVSQPEHLAAIVNELAT